MSATERDYYKVLQVDPCADPEIIAAAYRGLARKYHPDTSKAPDATFRMQEINKAYEVLHDPIARAQYDRTHSTHFSGSAHARDDARQTRDNSESRFHRGDGSQRRPESADEPPHNTEPKVTYRFSRLCFKAAIIEPLGDRDSFRVITPVGIFQFSKAAFYREFPNVLQSRSYRDNGIYHFPTVPQRALKYKIG